MRKVVEERRFCNENGGMVQERKLEWVGSEGRRCRRATRRKAEDKLKEQTYR